MTEVARDGIAAAAEARRRRLRLRFALVAAVGSVGMTIAMAMATSFWWWDQSASALGTDLTGGRWFNLTMVVLGVAFAPLSLELDALLRDAAAAGIVRRRWGLAARVGMYGIPVAFVLVGWFRIDEGARANTIHNVAGFAIPLIVMAMMLTIGFGTVNLFPRLSARSVAILGLIVAMFLLSVLELMSYALMEMASFAICLAWLWMLASRLADRLGGRPAERAAATTGA